MSKLAVVAAALLLLPALVRAQEEPAGGPDPGRPDPGRPDPGRPAPGRPDPGRPAPGRPDPGRPDPGEEAVIERILELQGEIDELAAALSPAARAELERRLAERREPAMAAPAAPPPRPASAAPAPAMPEPAVRPPPAEAPKPPVRRRLARGPHCNFLEALDGNGDGRISALDRYWRHLFLWNDQNGDRTIQQAEVASAYERKVREIAVDLDTFTRKKGTIGEIRLDDDGPVLDVRGDGIGGADDAVLVVDATRLKRGAGPEMLSASGEPLEGFQPFREGGQIRGSGGEVTVFRCP